ncbi:MAG: 2,3,4,5-tetrahydropyridine-2,6-dicarboxylate N-succinyltransferase [Alphaproteobacteria bacterium]|nr:2,3,4,5-tetrahydropyridine-2,6-dicarboxylate N-succinyltransferase [Alphaproteobacteria bacterium]
MSDTNLEFRIQNLWNGNSKDTSCIKEIMDQLDSGKIRVVGKINGKYIVNEYIKKAILLYFRNTESKIMKFGGISCFDKVPLKTENWTEKDFVQSEFRAVPGAIIRYSAYIAKSVVIMQAFVNVGAFIDEETMIDTNSLVGSCAQIGKRCHISAGVNIGGVLEPLQANPVIVEDDCFIGAGCSIMEGIIVEKGAVISAGVTITASTKILDRETGEITYGKIPSYSVIVPGTYPSGNVNLACAVIVKKCDEITRKKTSINDLLRF